MEQDTGKRYKLVRICNGKYLSANARGTKPAQSNEEGILRFDVLQYKVGKTTRCPSRGVACYKELRFANTPAHIHETQHHFNQDKPIAILELEPIGKPVWHSENYNEGKPYEGGVNYRAVKVTRVIKTIRKGG